MTDYMKKFSLKNKVAVVCGLGLIGNDISLAFAQAGAKLVVLDIDDNKGKIFEKECNKKGLDAKFIRFDITDIKNLSKGIKKIFYEEGQVHSWVNAAYPKTKDWGDMLEDVKPESWQKNVNMHMNSYCLITRDVAELMKEKRVRGSIINLSSIYGVVAPDFEVYSGTNMTSPAAYSAIKAGIINFSRYAASYYGKFGIRVNTVCPGGIFDNQNPKFVKNYEKKVPLRKMGKPGDVAGAALFLASDASSYITGTALMVDGGWTCI